MFRYLITTFLIVVSLSGVCMADGQVQCGTVSTNLVVGITEAVLIQNHSDTVPVYISRQCPTSVTTAPIYLSPTSTIPVGGVGVGEGGVNTYCCIVASAPRTAAAGGTTAYVGIMGAGK